MATTLSATACNWAEVYPNKKIVRRDPAWPIGTLFEQYIAHLGATDPGLMRIRPDVLVLRPDGERLFLVTNTHGLIGEEIDFSKRLVAVWGDSCVAGWGMGWIDGLSGRFPGVQILNGGCNHSPIDNIAFRAIETNRRLPIETNLIFPGWCTMMRTRTALQTAYEHLRHLVQTLPNPILCTQPTALNEEMVTKGILRYLAPPEELGYRAGFTFWSDLEPTPELVSTMYRLIVAQNEVIRQIAFETALQSGKFIPVIDFQRRFDTQEASDPREHFFDAGHFRVESYPYVQQVFEEELSGFLTPDTH